MSNMSRERRDIAQSKIGVAEKLKNMNTMNKAKKPLKSMKKFKVKKQRNDLGI